MTNQRSIEAEACYSRGVHKYFRKKNFVEAIADLTKAIELMPDYKEAISYRDVAIIRLNAKREKIKQS